MKLEIKTIFGGHEPLEVVCIPTRLMDNKCDTNNHQVGTEVFKWLYSKVPRTVWEGFFTEASKPPDLIIKALEENKQP